MHFSQLSMLTRVEGQVMRYDIGGKEVYCVVVCPGWRWLDLA
jgi:hypothetical protein